MSAFTSIKTIRKRLVRFLTRNYRAHRIIGSPVEKILIVRPNHRLGNQLLLTPLLQEIEKHYPKAQVSLLVKGSAAPALFQSYNIHRIFQLPRFPLKYPLRYLQVLFQALSPTYDLAFNVISSSSSGRLFTLLSNAKTKFIENEQDFPGQQSMPSTHMAKVPVWAFRKVFLGETRSMRDDDVYRLDIKLRSDELKKGHSTLMGLFNNDEKPKIALYTYATGAKMYSREWWNTFIMKMKDSYPMYNFVEILPIENVSQLEFSIPSFYTRDIRKMSSVIANCIAFIGADSGVMHLASASGTPTIGLFKVTKVDTYSPYGNASVGIDTTKGDLDRIVTSLTKILCSDGQTITF